jgi:tetratricopeptide (TPR) repeat protein
MKIRYLSLPLMMFTFTVGMTVPSALTARPVRPSVHSHHSAAFYHERGLDKNRSGDVRGAIRNYNIAIQLDHRNETFYYDRGQAKLSLNDYKGAIADFNAAIDINSQFSEAHYSRGAAREHLGDFDGARLDFYYSRQLMRGQRGY